MESYADQIQIFLQEWGAPFVLVMLFLENVPFVGFFAPAILTLIIVGFSLADSPSELAILVAVGYIGVVCSDTLWYYIGRWSGGRWRYLRAVDSRASDALRTLKEQPRWILWFYQFIPYFRMFLPFALGAAEFPRSRWFPVNLVASSLYVLFWTGVGFAAAHLLIGLEGAHSVATIATIIITTLSVLYIVRLVSQYRKRRSDHENN